MYQPEDASNAALTWGLVLSITFISIIAALVLYYRRRVGNLKAEVNHVVNYMIQEQPPHFDNPVYNACQSGMPGGPPQYNGYPSGSTRHENNNGTLVGNNLGLAKSNWNKYLPEKETLPYSLQSTIDQKNLDANMTNPNYNTIDEKDHVYDEIKNNGYKDMDTEYDHLDYSRPGSSHKAHYYRMNNLLTDSPKEINILRDNRTINNLSSPGLGSRQPLVTPVGGMSGGAAAATTGSGAIDSSSSNSSPTPPLSGMDSSNLYVKMNSDVRGSSPAASEQDCNLSSSKIPEHFLNIK